MSSIFHTVLRIWAIIIIAIKRTLAQRGLVLATLLGLVVAIALVLSIPLYSEAVYYRVPVQFNGIRQDRWIGILVINYILI